MAQDFDCQKLEILQRDADNTIGRYANLFIQVRTGRMTVDALGRIEAAARLSRVRTTGPVGGIAILEETAEVVDRAVRERQREVIAGLVSDARTHMAAVILGSSVRAVLMRSVMRLVVPRRPRLYTARDLDDASAWLGSALGEPRPLEIRAVIEHVRDVAHAAARP